MEVEEVKKYLTSQLNKSHIGGSFARYIELIIGLLLLFPIILNVFKSEVLVESNIDQNLEKNSIIFFTFR